MSDLVTSKAKARERARTLLRQLRKQARDARTTAEFLQVPLNELRTMSFETGRIRGVIDQLDAVRRAANELLKDLREVADE
jgi:hypothetical protein